MDNNRCGSVNIYNDKCNKFKFKTKEQPSNTASTNTIKMNSISMDSDKSPITGDQITNDQKKYSDSNR